MVSRSLQCDAPEVMKLHNVGRPSVILRRLEYRVGPHCQAEPATLSVFHNEPFITPVDGSTTFKTSFSYLLSVRGVMFLGIPPDRLSVRFPLFLNTSSVTRYIRNLVEGF